MQAVAILIDPAFPPIMIQRKAPDDRCDNGDATSRSRLDEEKIM
jgi:hypothetical protein